MIVEHHTYTQRTFRLYIPRVYTRVREGGKATRYFCIVGNQCDSLAVVVVVAHFNPHLAGRLLASIGIADDCFCSF